MAPNGNFTACTSACAARMTELRDAHSTRQPEPPSSWPPPGHAKHSSRPSRASSAGPSTTRGGSLLLEGAWQSVLGWQPEQLHGWYWERARASRRPRARRARSCAGAPRQRPRARRRRAARAVRTGGYRLTYWTFVAGRGHGQHPRPRPRPHRSSRTPAGQQPTTLLEAPQRRARRAARRARGALRGGRALRGHRRPPARRAAGDRRELGDPGRRGARGGPRPDAPRPARRDRPRRRPRPPPDGRPAGRRTAAAGWTLTAPVDADHGRRGDDGEPRASDRGAPARRSWSGRSRMSRASPGCSRSCWRTCCPTRSSTARAPTAVS